MQNRKPFAKKIVNLNEPLKRIGFYQPLDGFTNTKHWLLCFLTTSFFAETEGASF
jgi:hypothetical protein